MSYYRTGDVVLFRGTSLLSRLIRVFTRDEGEAETKWNHVGVVVSNGSDPYMVEALARTRRVRLSRHADKDIAVFRLPYGLDELSAGALAHRANGYVGRRYGYVKLIAHLADWCLGGRYVFRRLARMDRYPICSWVVAYAYDAIGYRFGVPPYAASPDDIGDWVEHNQWRRV